MKDVIDSVEDLSNVDEAIQRKVRRALSGMRDILVRLPQDRLVEAEMVADQAKEFLTTASQSRINQTMVRSSSAGLCQAGERLDDIAPRVLTLCREITNLMS
jgi:hypothetical protein